MDDTMRLESPPCEGCEHCGGDWPEDARPRLADAAAREFFLTPATIGPDDILPICGGSPEADERKPMTFGEFADLLETSGAKTIIVNPPAAPDDDKQGAGKVVAEADACLKAVEDAAIAYGIAIDGQERSKLAVQMTEKALRDAMKAADWIGPGVKTPFVVGDLLIDGGSRPGKQFVIRKVRDLRGKTEPKAPRPCRSTPTISVNGSAPVPLPFTWTTADSARPIPPTFPAEPDCYATMPFGELPVGSRFTFVDGERFVFTKECDRTFSYFDMEHSANWPIAGPHVRVVHLGGGKPCPAS